MLKEYETGSEPWTQEAVGAWTAEAISQGFGGDLWSMVRVTDSPYESGMAAGTLRIGNVDYLLIVESLSPSRRLVRLE
jgi:hypothetical protein